MCLIRTPLYKLILTYPEKKAFSYDKVERELENISNLPGLLYHNRIISLAQMCAQHGWIKTRKDEERAKDLLEKEKYRAYTYTLTEDGREKLTPKMGKGADSGALKHRHYIHLVRDRMLLDSCDMLVINQDALTGKAQYLPDGEIRIMPIMDGRTSSQRETIKKCIEREWIWQYAKGCDTVNIEVELSTIGREDWIRHNFVKGLKQERVVFFFTSSVEDGEKIVSIVDDFIDREYKSYQIHFLVNSGGGDKTTCTILIFFSSIGKCVDTIILVVLLSHI